MICGKDSLLVIDPKSCRQQMIRSMDINDMESSECFNRPERHIRIDVAESERLVASKT